MFAKYFIIFLPYAELLVQAVAAKTVATMLFNFGVGAVNDTVKIDFFTGTSWEIQLVMRVIFISFRDAHNIVVFVNTLERQRVCQANKQGCMAMNINRLCFIL